MRIRLRSAKTATACLVLLTCQAPADWPTFGGDSQRSGWAQRETIIDKNNVRTLELKWKLQLDNAPRELTSLTPPVVADNVETIKGQKEYVLVGGSSDNLFAIDADTGKLAWTKHFSIAGTPSLKSNTLCPYALNATPVVQTGRPRTVYAISTDGKLHALNTVSGEDRFAPKQFVPPFTADHGYDLRIKGEALTETARTATAREIASIVSLEDQHTAEEVPVVAAGPGSAMVHGWVSNTDVFHFMMAGFGWEKYRVEKRYPVEGAGSWDYITMDSASWRLYVSHETKVDVLNADTGKTIGVIPDTPGVHGIAIAAKVNRGFTSNGREDKVTMFDAESLRVIGGQRPRRNLFRRRIGPGLRE